MISNAFRAWNLQKAFATLLRTTNSILCGGEEVTGAITMSGAGLVCIELRPDLNWASVQAHGKPTFVSQGTFHGFSLPLYAANEELFFAICVPGRYDGISDPKAHVDCWLSHAEDTKNFKLQLSWEHFTPGTDPVPTTMNDVEVQIATGASAPQFNSYLVPFAINYDIDTPDNLAAGNLLGLRLRRIPATGNEIAGEVVIAHIGVSFRRDKMGIAAP